MRSTICGAGHRNLRNSKGSAEIAEFVPVLYIAFLLVLMPLLDLVTVFVAGATQYLATNDFVAKSATQPDYASALNTMVTEAYQFQSNGLAKFAQMVPDGGFAGCGDDLYVLVTDTGTGAVTSSGADRPLSQKINTQSSMYELSVRSVYNVGPLVSLAAVPILGDIPGLGKPVTLAFSANRPVEHPGGFQGPGTGVQNTPVTTFARVAGSPNTTPNASNATWRTPSIYPQIKNAGEIVSGVAVVLVPANAGITNPATILSSNNWTSTGLSVTPGDKIWIDTSAVGIWNTYQYNINSWSSLNVDANGYPTGSAADVYQPSCLDPNINQGALMGHLGANGTPFFLGDDQYNYPLGGTGQLSVICNDETYDSSTGMNNMYWDNTGAQMVRVIVTK